MGECGAEGSAPNFRIIRTRATDRKIAEESGEHIESEVKMKAPRIAFLRRLLFCIIIPTRNALAARMLANGFSVH